MAPEIQAGEQRYATQVGELWSGLTQTLARLEAIALTPEGLDNEETVESLRLLQYRLHIAGESALGLSPPAAAEPAHSELAAALSAARDATGEVVEAVDAHGSRGVDALLYEWRGVLFRIRLARLRLTGGETQKQPVVEEIPRLYAPVAASLLTLAGTGAFFYGALVGPWPVWVAGIVAVCASLLVYRP